MTREILLGTSSFIRKQILSDMGYHLTHSLTADLDERSLGSRDSASDAPALVTLLAKAKADAIVQKIQKIQKIQKKELINEIEKEKTNNNPSNDFPVLLLTADSVVTFQDDILEKPDSLEMAASFLNSYGSGNPVSIVSGICITNIVTGIQHQVSGVSGNEILDYLK